MKYFIFLFTFCNVFIFAQPEIPKLTMWANDFTGTLSKSELNDLNNRLKTYQDTTSTQIVVLVISSLEGYPIEMLSEETATKNKIGTGKNNNGVLLLIAKDDKELRIEVGYGLEGAIPDAIASSIIRNEITPEFKNGNFYLGISNGIDAIIKAIGGEYKAEDSNTGSDDEFPFLFIIIFLIVIFLIARNSGPMSPGGIYRSGSGSSGWSGGSRSWGGSSGWSGGGGFSGGGGSFGGGGASGSW
ncbi:MAG: TPM domain-containing protein [Ignavibacteriales bacterium]|nr:TPM domain-containing protein [Ignavibacteriaceae bacterium]MEB2354322.1 TPM domain-containing protein [Ignavibacteriales bacterium]GIK22303.1 MAG: hypothetical protein BroJett005_17170 [Ignavibacteriota bacterium]